MCYASLITQNAPLAGRVKAALCLVEGITINLAEYLCKIIALALGRALSNNEIRRIHESVDSHGLAQIRDNWMIEFLNSIECASYVTEYIPVGYPEGEEGLANIFADIEDIIGSDFKDYGEGIEWNIPNLKVFVFICRETGNKDYFYRISRST